MGTENDTKKEFDEAYLQGNIVWGEWYTQAHTDLKNYLGDQWSAQDKLYLKNQDRNVFVFNKIKRAVELVDGYQRKNVLSLRIQAMEQSDDEIIAMMQDKTASQFSSIVMFLMQYSGGYNILNDCFAGALKTALNFLRLYVDYTDDMVNGDIKFMRCAYNQIMVDPYFSHRDFSDCQYILFREFITKEEGMALFPKNAGPIEKMTALDADSKFVYLKTEKDLMGDPKLRFDEFFKRTVKPIHIIVDKETGDYEEFTGTKKSLEEALRDSGMGERFQIINRYKPTVEHNVWLNDELMYSGPEAFGLDDFPYIPIFAYFDPEYDSMKWKLQSYVRCMLDPQKEVNKRRSQITDITDSQINSGWQAEEGSQVDPDALYGSGQGKVLWHKIGKQPAQKIEATNVPAGLFQVIQMIDKDIMEIPGGNSEMFGAPEHDNMEISGILSKLRTGAGLTILQPIFDNLRFAKKLLGQKLVKLIQKNYSPQKVKKIIKEEPTPEFYSKDFGKYDCVPCEGILTDTQKQMYFTQLLFMKRSFPDCPIPWDVILEAAPMENKDKVIERIKQAEAAQQKTEQMQMAMQMLEMKLRNAQLGTEIATAQEKIAESQKNRAIALDEHMQGVKKMQQMDTQQLKDLMGIMQMLETWLEPKLDNAVPKEPNIATGGQPGGILPSILSQGGSAGSQAEEPVKIISMPSATVSQRKRIKRTKR
ncbi:MAG: hypothetical protein M0R74_16965 [Dehalococcoidia bacterium]|nr:hypothetical protein [Dehalococcoidia bacterium]